MDMTGFSTRLQELRCYVCRDLTCASLLRAWLCPALYAAPMYGMLGCTRRPPYGPLRFRGDF